MAFCPVYDSTYLEAQQSQLGPVADKIDFFLQAFQGLIQLGLQTPEQLLCTGSLIRQQHRRNSIKWSKALEAGIDAAVSLKTTTGGGFGA